MTGDKKEYDLKMQEYAQLLDIRADRIRVSIAIQVKLHSTATYQAASNQSIEIVLEKNKPLLSGHL